MTGATSSRRVVCKIEQTLSPTGLSMRDLSGAMGWVRTMKNSLKHKHGWALLALALFAAAPAFADKISADFTDEATRSVSIRELTEKRILPDASFRDFGPGNLKEDEFRVALDPTVRMSNIDRDGEDSSFGNRQVRLLGLGSKLGESFRSDDGKKTRREHLVREDGNDSSSAVAISEPRTLRLLLFGLLLLGMIVCRNKRPTSAI